MRNRTLSGDREEPETERRFGANGRNHCPDSPSLGSFAIAWLAVSMVAGWFVGSGTILVSAIAVVVGAGVYLDILRQDRPAG